MNGSAGIQPMLRAGQLSILTARAFVAMVSPPSRVSSWVRQAEQIGVRSLLVAAISSLTFVFALY